MHVAVLGAGVIGVTTAYYLSERGHSATILDRASEVASGASGRNGGQLSYSFTDAMASPALLGKMPAIMTGLNPAFYVRSSIDPDLVRWGLAFLGQCTTSKHRKNTLEILQLALRSGELMTELRSRTSVEFSHRRAGKLVTSVFSPPMMPAIPISRSASQIMRASSGIVRSFESSVVKELPVLALRTMMLLPLKVSAS